MNFRVPVCVLVAVVVAGVVSSTALADQPRLDGLRFGFADGITRMVISVPSTTEYTIDTNEAGTMIRVDLADVGPPKERLMTRRLGLIKRTALSQHSGGLRLALNLKDAGRVIATTTTVDAAGGHGIVIDLARRSWQPVDNKTAAVFLEHAPESLPDLTAWGADVKPAGYQKNEDIAAWLWSTYMDKQAFALAPPGTQPVSRSQRVGTADVSR